MTSALRGLALCVLRRLPLICVAAACLLPAGAASAAPLSEEDVAAAVKGVIAERSRDGAFPLRDPKTDADLSLVLEDVRVVRGLEGYGWFPDVIFHDRAEPKKKYAVDFWLKPEGPALKLMDVRIHKEPRPDGASWMSVTRAPLLWWWQPTIKRQSAVAGLQAWEVLGLVHEHVVRLQTDGGFPLTDEAGKSIPAELVEFHLPVGRAKEGARYFACADFRKLRDGKGVLSVDFEVDPKTRSVVAGNARVRAPPPAEGTKKPPQPRCSFAGLAVDTVE